MIKYWNTEMKEYNHPYDKFKEFLDKCDFITLGKEFRNRLSPVNIWIPLDEFIVFIYNKIKDDFKVYCDENNLSDEEYDLLIRIESRDFWDRYIRDRIGLWTSNISAYCIYDIDRLFFVNLDK